MYKQLKCNDMDWGNLVASFKANLDRSESKLIDIEAYASRNGYKTTKDINAHFSLVNRILGLLLALREIPGEVRNSLNKEARDARSSFGTASGPDFVIPMSQLDKKIKEYEKVLGHLRNVQYLWRMNREEKNKR